MGDQPVARPLATHNERTQTSMPLVGFKPMIPVFEWAKTVHALDRVTVIGFGAYIVFKLHYLGLSANKKGAHMLYAIKSSCKTIQI
jgi:hypothetical protein